MAISKIILNGVTQMDLTQDTVAAGNLISPNTAHGADGETVTGTASLIAKNITTNGTYNASSDNVSGYSSVVVNVSGGGGSDWVTLVDSNININQGTPNWSVINNYTTPIAPGEQYRVTWENLTHVYIARIDGVGASYDGYYYGNSVVVDPLDDDGSGIPALFMRSNANQLQILTTDTVGTKYLKIERNTRVLSFQEKTNINPTNSNQTIRADVGYDALLSVQINAIPSGTEGTPTATKGTVSNHSISVTPSVTNTMGYIAGGTHTGTAVTVSASELVSGSETKTENGTYDVTNLSSLIVSVAGSSLNYDTKTVTASNNPVSLSFTSMNAEPKAFVVRLNTQVSSSGSTTYYYIVDITAFGDTCHGNCFRIGSTRRIDTITSGYSFSYSGTTLTITSSAASRSASPGAFYNGSYELLYIY